MRKELYQFCKAPEESSNLAIVYFDRIKNLNTDNRESVVSEARVILKRDRRSRLVGTMILKTYENLEADSNDFPEISPENMFKKYKKLREIGIPVVNTFRYDSRNTRYLMTDLTENGKNIIIDKHNKYKNTPILINNMEEVRKEIKRIADIAWTNEIYLSSDAYAVIVNKKTRYGKVHVLDFGQLSYEIKHEYCLIWNTEEDAMVEANSFISNCLSRH